MIANLAVPVSGTGSLLEAMIAQQIPIRLVFADRPCRGLEIAKSHNIPTVLFLRSFKDDFNTAKRREYTLEIVGTLQSRSIHLVAMAGFMTVFAPVMFEYFPDRITNIHPALLPAFKGHHAVRDALLAGVKVTGTTIHYATEKLDDGKIIAQEPVRVHDGDTEETLHERIKIVERRIYPAVVAELLAKLS
jgi:phosphoribosylglycinamide formyltransferase-1